MNKTNTKSKLLTSGKIVHRLPGRMRVRIDRLHDDISYGNDLRQAVNALAGVTEVRVNSLASSIVITYRTIELSEQNLLDCLGVSFPIVEVRTESSADRADMPSDVNSIAEAENLTAKITSEVIGETVGEIVGETVGELLMGPAGMLIGAELGGKLGEEVGDLVEESVLPESGANKPQPPNPPERNNQRNSKRGK